MKLLFGFSIVTLALKENNIFKLYFSDVYSEAV